MKINFRDKDLELHYSMRIYIIYENIIGEGVEIKDLNSYTSILTLFYSAIVASLQYHKMDSDVTYDEFIDWIDTDTSNKIQEFSEWFVKKLVAQQDKIDEKYEKEIKAEKGNKKSKK